MRTVRRSTWIIAALVLIASLTTVAAGAALIVTGSPMPAHWTLMPMLWVALIYLQHRRIKRDFK